MQARKCRRSVRDEQTDGPCGNRQTENAAGERQQRALAEEVANDPESACTERPANGDLALARVGSHQEQIRHVRRRHEHHDADRGEQNPQRTGNAADRRVYQPSAGEHEPRFDVPDGMEVARKGIHDVADQTVQFCARAVERHAVPQPRDALVAPQSEAHLSRQRFCNPHVDA